MFGSNNLNQIPNLSGNLKNVGSFGPQLVELNLNTDETIIKAKAQGNRSAVITSEGRAFIWGEKDLSIFCIKNIILDGPFHEGIEELSQQIGEKINDVGLGYLHTVLLTTPN